MSEAILLCYSICIRNTRLSRPLSDIMTALADLYFMAFDSLLNGKIAVLGKKSILPETKNIKSASHLAYRMYELSPVLEHLILHPHVRESGSS